MHKRSKYQKKLHFRSFEEAREFVRALELKNYEEWYEYSKSGKRPKDIPSSPQGVYKGKGWKGMGNFLGVVLTNFFIKKEYRPFEEAREFVRALGLENYREWIEYARSGRKPEDIPTMIHRIYKGRGWKNMGDFLGSSRTIRRQPETIRRQTREFRPFEEARKFVRALGLKNGKEWYEYSKSGKRPEDIPSSPSQTYKGKGWKTWGDFLRTGKREFRSFEEAREFARALKLKNYEEWYEYSKSSKRPEDIPSSPYVYKGKGWKGLGDFLGTGTTAPQNMKYRSFEEAREFARALKLPRGKYKWAKYVKSGKKPNDIPSSVHTVYKDKGWKGWGDFLGTGKREFRPFEEAREFARALGLKNGKEWNEYSKSGKRPEDTPSSPSQTYKGKGWKTWGDFLGTGKREFRPFEESREFVRALGLKSSTKWKELHKSGKKPNDIPSSVHIVYKDKGWKGWDDFLGTGKREFRPFEEAREFARILGLKNRKEWNEYSKSGKRPEDIPSEPSRTYKDRGWKDMTDWLGTEHRGFINGRKFVRTLGLKNQIEWKEYARSGKKPEDIPSRPSQTYKKQWKGLSDWLGIKKYSKKNSKSFYAARRFARTLGLKSSTKWKELHKSGKIPVDIPSSVDATYKDKGWKGWGDFLGTGNLGFGTIANQNRNILPYNEAEKLAKRICKKLKINTPIEWQNAAHAGKIPKNLPTFPPTYYQKKRGIAKNVENEFYTTWFKFSGTSSKWTEEMSYLVFKEVTRKIYDPNLLLDTFMLLHTNYVLKDPKQKAEFADMFPKIIKGKMKLDQIDFKGKMYTTIILFYIANFIIPPDFGEYYNLNGYWFRKFIEYQSDH